MALYSRSTASLKHARSRARALLWDRLRPAVLLAEAVALTLLIWWPLHLFGLI